MSAFSFPPGYDTARWLSFERQRGAKLLVLHEPHRRVRRCSVCSRRLDTPSIWTMDCDGGECLECVATGTTRTFVWPGGRCDVVDVPLTQEVSDAAG